MERTYKNVELVKETAEGFKRFLKAKGIHYEPSSCFDLVHFEVLVNDEETEMCENWLSRH